MSSRMRPTIIFGGIDRDVPQSGMTARTKGFSRTVFVRALLQRLTHGPRHYERGPTTLDEKSANWMLGSAWRTCNHVGSNWKLGESAVSLADYSCSGAAVIEVAKCSKDGVIGRRLVDR
jgi:hypothetical protein